MVEPHASAWRHLEAAARDRGLVHAMEALRFERSPADVADLAADMVEWWVLRPVAVDLAGAGSSARAFRGLQRIGAPSSTWCRAEAHLWTYELE